MVLIDGWYSESVTPRIRTGSADSTHTENSDDVLLRVAGLGPHTACRDFFRNLRDTCRKHSPRLASGGGQH
ncbi:hypothetical protein [Streptomyces buecherae]|uniref:hypothetical protein n=1 Tax=Streptomyces buecherae TaxID=2763006 RepID=UPI003797A506